jgi:hypothetical protein
MRRTALVVAAALSVAAAGCGSSDPHLNRDDAAQLIALASRVAREGPCAQKRDLATLKVRAIALVNRKAVPADLQESFVAGVNDLADRTPVCEPPPPAPSVVQPPPGKHGKHGKGHGKHDHGDEG